ncbi:MAG: SagB/ThcOx family dehydrogenase [Gammaproteobacteria bacterium]|nr:SagB/ThcOx family dehydrogenase [Gammaproteobacteria bacterium]
MNKQPGLPASLPEPAPATTGTLGNLLRQRRSWRQFGRDPLSLAATGELLWATQGVTGADGRRVTPSAGGLYPLEVLLIAGHIAGLVAGLYRYQPAKHALVPVAEGDHRQALAAASWGQDFLADAAAIVVIAAINRRTTAKYRQRGIRYVHMEAGHAAQNLYLMATALGLRTVVVGAFGDAATRRVLHLARDETPLALLPVGTAGVAQL